MTQIIEKKNYKFSKVIYKLFFLAKIYFPITLLFESILLGTLKKISNHTNYTTNYTRKRHRRHHHSYNHIHCTACFIYIFLTRDHNATEIETRVPVFETDNLFRFPERLAVSGNPRDQVVTRLLQSCQHQYNDISLRPFIS